MLRKIVEINSEKCNGCGLCVNACHEGAIKIINGKATLISDEYCDGLGNCLPACPVDAINIIERDAKEYDDNLVQQKKKESEAITSPQKGGCNCPGGNAKVFAKRENHCETNINISSELSQWPVQLGLVNPSASFFDGCNLLFAADCSAFAYGNFHRDFIKDHVCIIGCPKLDQLNEEKITEILKNHEIKSFTVVRMEVPCCGGLVQTSKQAIQNSGKKMELITKTISLDGNLV